jgi:Mitovirus RNA-dependent RNA polymerase
MVVQYSAFLVGEYPTKSYIMLGDDVVITKDKIAKQHIELTKKLGVETSPMKTHISKTTYEFAKI